eukprot:TRINITY_DN32960_c0_g1_i1.p1 TRINITY_DN32960_c0_g1~~TRINITY_DN32960_c0_g1_i1.p1  ORF type:complete len:119 (-),score=5.89 TRINITY_DN32960_c0_g1_i1:168-524(-)
MPCAVTAVLSACRLQLVYISTKYSRSSARFKHSSWAARNAIFVVSVFIPDPRRHLAGGFKRKQDRSCLHACLHSLQPMTAGEYDAAREWDKQHARSMKAQGRSKGHAELPCIRVRDPT